MVRVSGASHVHMMNAS